MEEKEKEMNVNKYGGAERKKQLEKIVVLISLRIICLAVCEALCWCNACTLLYSTLHT